MTVITETATFENDAEVPPDPGTVESARPVEVCSDLAWLLAQVYIPASRDRRSGR